MEQDKLQLDAPVDSLLPELANMRLVDGSAAKRKITLRMLVSSAVVAGKAALANRKPVVLCLLAMDLIKLSHTAGFAYTVRLSVLFCLWEFKFVRLTSETASSSTRSYTSGLQPISSSIMQTGRLTNSLW